MLFNLDKMLDATAESTFFSQNRLLMFLNFVYIISAPLMYSGEIKEATPYSKFAAPVQEEKKAKMIPSREGMLFIYFPAVLVAGIYILAVSLGLTSRFEMNLAAFMVLIHFLKRTLEVLFLHKYSGSTVLSAARAIGFMYASHALLICTTSNSAASQTTALVGTSLFVVGTVGNFYHHYLLASLRSSDSNKGEGKKYVAPKGGLFEYVAAPHYLFELLGWLGIAVASAQITAYTIFVTMVAYLGARSYNQNEWNKGKFSKKEWPPSRKNLVPFVY